MNNENNSVMINSPASPVLVPMSVSSLPSVKTDKRGRYSKGRILTDEEMKLLKGIDIWDIVRNDKRISDTFHNEMRVRYKKFSAQRLKNEFFAQSVLTAILHDRIIKSLNNSTRSPLRGLSKYQIDMLCLVYSYGELMDGGVFTKQMVRKSGLYKFEIDSAFDLMINKGWIKELDANEVYTKTKKVKRKTGKPYAHYCLTRQGKLAMKEYFAAYEKIHKDITGHLLVDDLEFIDTKLSKK